MLKMHAVLDGKMNGMTFQECKDCDIGYTFGGFSFTCNIHGEEKDVPIDWDSWVANVQKDGTLILHEGEKTWFGGDEKPDDIYDEQYKKDGYSRSDLTAELLSKTTDIVEFTFDYDILDEFVSTDYLHIVSLSFEDETGIYSVDGDVLSRFNNMEPFISIKAEGDIGSYDEFDGNYPDESDLSYKQNMQFSEEEELPF